MLPPADIDREVRLHADALRCIAKDLLRDPHAADDVTQATLHKALTHRELQPGSLGGWLQRVLENFARQWRRGERRRLVREARVATPEPEPCPAETLMRRESLRAVTEAVLQLDEPYQTTVFLRYFEDLPPRAIARQTNTSIATVKSRLARGLTMLRQRLDRQHQHDGTDWRRGLSLTFGLPLTATGAITITTGAWLMGSATKALFAAGALCAGGWFAFRLREDPPPQQVATPSAAADATAAVASSHVAGESRAPERESAPEQAPVEPWLAHPFTFELEVLVVDALGLPVAGHVPGFAPMRVERNDLGATEPDGRTLLSWRSRVPTGEVVVTDGRGLLRKVLLQHERRAFLTLTAEQADHEYYIRTLEVTVGPSADGSSRPACLHPHAVFTTAGAVVPVIETPTHFQTPIVFTPFNQGRLLIADIEGIIRLRTMQPLLQLAAPAPISFSTEVQVEPTGLTGTVFGEDGKPAAMIDVVLLGTSPQPLQHATTDSEGQFTFSDLEPGALTVRAGGDAHGLATIPATVTEGLTCLQVSLHREACVRGRVVNEAGQPVGKAKLGWHAADGSWGDATTTNDDGTFVFANVPAVPGNVFLWPEGSGPLPTVIATHVLPNDHELLLRHDAGSGRSLLLEPMLPQACEGAAIEIRVWQAGSGFGALVPEPEVGRPWCLEHLPPGWYEVEVRAAGSGVVNLGHHLIDGLTDCDLGRIALPAAGNVRFVVPAAALPENTEQHAFEICELRADLDVRIALEDIPRDRVIHLPAGNYVFGFRHRDGGVRFHAFTVLAGVETIVTVPE